MSDTQIKVHGKCLNDNISVLLKALKIVCEDNKLKAITRDFEERASVISLLVSNGFSVISCYRRDIGWIIETTGNLVE